MSEVIKLDEHRPPPVDFVVVLSTSSLSGETCMQEFVLSKYRPSKDAIAFSILREEVLPCAAKASHVYWVSVNFVMGKQLITCMRGDVDWLRKVEYFKKLIGGMGGEGDVAPSAYGFIDQKHGIRVEFENGVIAISELK